MAGDQVQYFESFNDFTLFLYMFMADSDGDIDESELNVIRKKIPKLFPENPDADQLLQDAKRNYQSMDAAQVEEVIKLNFKQHQEKSFTFKYKIFADLYEIIVADGVVDDRENASMEKLKQIIDQNLARPTD